MSRQFLMHTKKMIIACVMLAKKNFTQKIPLAVTLVYSGFI